MADVETTTTTTTTTTTPPDRKPGPSLHVVDDDDVTPVIRRRRPNRVVAWFRGYADEHLSREQVAAGLGTLLWVAPLTVLIWIYAERQQQDVRPGVVLPLAVVSGDATKVVRLTSPSDGNVVVTLRGPRGAIDEALKRFNPLTGNRPVEIQLDRTSGLGEQRVRAFRVGEDKRLADAGITVDAVEPGELRVYVDQIVTRKLPVQAQATDATRLFGAPPTFDPKEVEVTGPSRILDSPDSPLRVEADLAARLRPDQPAEGERVLKDVKLSLAGLAPGELKYITLLQSAVTARVIPVARQTVTLLTVRLFPAGPLFLMNENRYEINPGQLSNVKVSGPAEAVRAFEADTKAHFGYVLITPPEPGTSEITADVVFNLPPGLTWDDEPERKKVRVTVQPK